MKKKFSQKQLFKKKFSKKNKEKEGKRKNHKKGEIIKFDDYPEFQPNLTPRQIFLLGSFGGTYWRPIHSNITGEDYKDEHLKFKTWWKGIDESYLTSTTYDENKNKYNISMFFYLHVICKYTTNLF